MYFKFSGVFLMVYEKEGIMSNIVDVITQAVAKTVTNWRTEQDKLRKLERKQQHELKQLVEKAKQQLPDKIEKIVENYLKDFEYNEKYDQSKSLKIHLIDLPYYAAATEVDPTESITFDEVENGKTLAKNPILNELLDFIRSNKLEGRIHAGCNQASGFFGEVYAIIPKELIRNQVYKFRQL